MGVGLIAIGAAGSFKKLRPLRSFQTTRKQKEHLNITSKYQVHHSTSLTYTRRYMSAYLSTTVICRIHRLLSCSSWAYRPIFSHRPSLASASGSRWKSGWDKSWKPHAFWDILGGFMRVPSYSHGTPKALASAFYRAGHHVPLHWAKLRATVERPRTSDFV